MKLFEYIQPENPIAQWVVYALLVLFILWLASLGWSFWRHLRYLSDIRRGKNVRKLRERLLARDEDGQNDEKHVAQSSDTVFYLSSPFVSAKNNNPIVRHVKAIFEAGWNESQLDAQALIKATNNQLFHLNAVQRTILSIFIVLGLLGTLFGLADTMASLDSLLRQTAQLDPATLSDSLHALLGTLKGAFAPSIWGVSLTVIGVVIFAVYLRMVASPLSNALETTTLTVWVPELMPTASQRVQLKLRLSDEQMKRAVKASHEVAVIADGLTSRSGVLLETLGLANDAFERMTSVAERLNAFSNGFVQAVNSLTSFQTELRSLYQQMANESRAFQTSVQQNIAGSEEFQKRIQDQLNNQHQQTVELLQALRSYESAYVKSREGIDQNLAQVAEKAGLAFDSLSRRNEEITAALDTAIGSPLRTELTRELGEVRSGLQKVAEELEAQLRGLGERFGRLDQPLVSIASKFNETFANFDFNIREWLKTIQTEFHSQNETNQDQLKKLEGLSQQIPQLLQQLTDSSNKFTESSGGLAVHGTAMAESTRVLSDYLATLGRGVEALHDHVSHQPGLDGDRTAKLLMEQIALSQEMRRRLEAREKK